MLSSRNAKSSEHTGPVKAASAWLRARFAPSSIAETGPAPSAAAGAKKIDPRRKIAIWAIGLGLLAGAIDLMRPAEDAFSLIRAFSRLRPADGQTVLVFVDDKTLTSLNTREVPRSADAKVLDTLVAAGASKVIFDRAYADASTPAEDAAFIAALERNSSRVYIGSTPPVEKGFGAHSQLLTHPNYRGKAGMVSMMGKRGPFGLSWKLTTSSFIDGFDRPSISAVLAGVQPIGVEYRPDFSIDYETIPNHSYIDILNGKVNRKSFAGKDVIVAPANRMSPDLFDMPFRGFVSGAQIHAIGGQTLREGFPKDLGWFPALVIIGFAVLMQARRTVPSRRITLAAITGLIALPFALDLTSTHLEVLPAAIVLSIATLWLHALARTKYRRGTGLLRIEGLSATGVAPNHDVVALKIRNFATISATLAPAQVDELLMKARGMLLATEPDTQFAFEKDTFVWLRERMCLGELEDHMRGLHALFRTSIVVGHRASDVASSLGLDTNRSGNLRERIEDAIQCAEDAAHCGKVFLVSETRDSEDREWRVQILSEFENAVANGEVALLYQPKVDLRSGTVTGAEALLRWTHPVRGFIQPDLLVAAAEQHNRVEMVTRFVLDRAIGEAKGALDLNPNFRVAVNISALDLQDRRFPDLVREALRFHAFPAANLVLEITETAPVDNDTTAMGVLEAVRRLGTKLSVDDFGVGHASLHYLRRIPSDEVKIDKSFVTGIGSSPDDEVVVRTVIDMIHSLGRTVVAEGVEDAATVAILRNLNCDVGQGYYFSRALPMPNILERLQKDALAA